MHPVANTPAESRGAHFALFPHDGSLPRFLGGSASALRLSRPAQRSLTLRPAYLPSHLHDPLHRRLQPLRCLRGCPDCYRLERPCRAGFAPAEKPCLRTAHQKSYASGDCTTGSRVAFCLPTTCPEQPPTAWMSTLGYGNDDRDHATLGMIANRCHTPKSPSPQFVMMRGGPLWKWDRT
jgi:hypothetical protein